MDYLKKIFFMGLIGFSLAIHPAGGFQDALLRAIQDDSAQEIKQAIAGGADVNKPINGNLPLSTAILLKKEQAVEALLESGAKVSKEIAPHIPSLGNVVIAYLAVMNGADIKGSEESYMRLAVGAPAFDPKNKETALELVKKLLEMGFDANKTWYLGPNKLGQIYPMGLDVLKIVLGHGADPNYIFSTDQINSEFTPLIYFVYFGTADMLEYLLEHGAKVNLKGNPYPRHPKTELRGEHTPLFYAVARNNERAIEVLLKYGGNLSGEKSFDEALIDELQDAFDEIAKEVKSTSDAGKLSKKLHEAAIEVAKTISDLFQAKS